MPQTNSGLLRRAVRFLVVLAALAGSGWYIVRLPENAPPPRDGWTVLRPPDDDNALVYFDDKIIAGGRDGIFVIDPATALPIQSPIPTPAMTYVKALLVDRAGQLWVGHRSGLARFDGNEWQTLHLSPSMPPGPVTALLQTGDGQILVGGEAGLAALQGSELVPVPVPPERANNDISALFEDVDERLWVGIGKAARGGLLVRTNGAWREIGLANGMPHTAVTQIGQSADGHLIVAAGFAGRGGVCQLTRADDLNSWTCLGSTDGLVSDMVRLAQADSHGQMWYGSEFHGAAVFSDDQMTALGITDGLAGLELKAFLEDPDGTLWLGCDKGLTRIDATEAVITQ